MSTPRAIEGCQVYSEELEFMDAADLVPELLSVVSPAFGAGEGNDDAATGNAISAMARAMTGGKIRNILPRLLKCTVVVVPAKSKDSPGGKFDLCDGEGAINDAFRGRKKLAIAVIKHVLGVNFSDFFDGSDLAGLAAAAKR